MPEWRTVRVPASSANLGPGFDALGLALGIYLECRFRPADELSIRASGVDADLIPASEDNLIWRAARLAGAGPVELEIRNQIPIGKGLGSSAAAVTAGVVIASELSGRAWDRSAILDQAARIEKHPDNVAACVLGGLTCAAMDGSEAICAAHHHLHPDYSVAVVVPDFVLPTEQARLVLPDSYSRQDAIFNVQRTAVLVSALTAGAANLFPAALEDRLHQPYRARLVPGLNEILQLRAPGLLGCALSGAGPSVVVFHLRGREEVCERVRAIFAAHGKSAQVLRPGVPEAGFVLV